MDRSFVPATLRTGKPPAAETVNKVVRIFKIVLDYAEDAEFIAKDPINKIDYLFRQNYKKRDILTKDEIKQRFPKDHTELIKNGKRYLVVHSLRHTVNTLMLEVMDPSDLRSAVGHSSERMTKRYSHQTPKTVIETVTKRYKKTIDKIRE